MGVKQLKPVHACAHARRARGPTTIHVHTTTRASRAESHCAIEHQFAPQYTMLQHGYTTACNIVHHVATQYATACNIVHHVCNTVQRVGSAAGHLPRPARVSGSDVSLLQPTFSLCSRRRRSQRAHGVTGACRTTHRSVRACTPRVRCVCAACTAPDARRRTSSGQCGVALREQGGRAGEEASL